MFSLKNKNIVYFLKSISLAKETLRALMKRFKAINLIIYLTSVFFRIEKYEIFNDLEQF